MASRKTSRKLSMDVVRKLSAISVASDISEISGRLLQCQDLIPTPPNLSKAMIVCVLHGYGRQFRVFKSLPLPPLLVGSVTSLRLSLSVSVVQSVVIISYYFLYTL